MKIKTTGKGVIKEVPYGVYVWCMPDGKYVGDEDNRFLSIPSTEGDKQRIYALEREVRSFGVEGGWPLFLSGNRQVTDEEFEEQRQRLAFGLTPDPQDVPAINDERRMGQ